MPYVQLITTKTTNLKTRHLGRDYMVEVLHILRPANGRCGNWSLLEAKLIKGSGAEAQIMIY